MSFEDKPKTEVDLVEVKDPDGHISRHYKVVGTNVYLPPFPNLDERFKELPHLKAHEDDILISGYAKCGTHWVWEIVGMLLQGEAEYIRAIKESVMIEAVSNSVLDVVPTPRVLNSHVSPSFIPRDFMNKKCKIIYLIRNPKDMLVSLYNHTYNLFPFYGYDGRWSGYFELFMEGKVDYGDWFQYVLEWEKFINSRQDLPIIVLPYEHLKKDPVKEIRRLAMFLGTRDDPALFQEIAEQCSFQKMKTAKSAFDDEVEKADWRDGKPLMYRKGEVGDWQNWFTVSQNERFDAKLKRKLATSELRFTYVL